MSFLKIMSRLDVLKKASDELAQSKPSMTHEQFLESWNAREEAETDRELEEADELIFRSPLKIGEIKTY